MNSEEWLTLLNKRVNGEISDTELLYLYCIHKGKDKTKSQAFIQFASIGFMPITIEDMISAMWDDLCVEFSFIKSIDKENKIRLIYQNKQNNGKEIHKIRAGKNEKNSSKR